MWVPGLLRWGGMMTRRATKSSQPGHPQDYQQTYFAARNICKGPPTPSHGFQSRSSSSFLSTPGIVLNPKSTEQSLDIFRTR
jgi:hypothetical protein